MKIKFCFIVVFAVALAVLLGYLTIYIVDETNQAVVKEFGKIKYVSTEPGVHLKLPWRNVNFYDKRILLHDGAEIEVFTKDKKQIVIDKYAGWIISDAAIFEASLGSVENAKKVMHEIIVSEFKTQMGSYNFVDIIRNRDKMLTSVLENCDEKLNPMGIKLVDVRVKKITPPEKNFASISKRMVTERETIASRYRTEAEQQTVEIKSYADRVSDSLIQTANTEATIIRARADSTAMSIYNKAFRHDRNFFDFVKTLEMYKNTMDTAKVLVIPHNSAIYRLLITGRL